MDDRLMESALAFMRADCYIMVWLEPDGSLGSLGHAVTSDFIYQVSQRLQQYLPQIEDIENE